MKRVKMFTMPLAGKNTLRHPGENATSSSAWQIISRGKGNRKQTKAGGDQNGANQRLAGYTVNSLHPVRYTLSKAGIQSDGLDRPYPAQMKQRLSHGVNQITSRNYPGTNDVIGVALATNTAVVNGQTAWRKGEYFWATVSTNNSSSANWEQVTVASGGNNSVGGLYVAQTPESFTYDLDGNLLSDGRWNYTWDGENRLVAMTNNTGVGPLYGLAFVYDSKGRRIEKTVTTNGTSFATLNFLYDGWNPVAILNSQSSIIESFTWGIDLSGSQQGAGGVGGLLAVHYVGTANTNCFAAYDGNGNVAGLINAAGGTLAASYEYGPFGEVIRQTGPMAKVNPFRFSTKYQDDESDLLYYGHRYYKASTGTWVSRDPLWEKGFDSVFGAAINKRKSNSEKAHDYLAKLYLEKPHLRQELEPLANRINWDMVNIPDDESKQREASNLYEFVNDDPISFNDIIGLNLWGPGLVDVQFCLINVGSGSGLTFPPAVVFGFTPASANCSTYRVKKCCKMANITFDSVYNGIPGTPGTGYAVALAAAAAVFNDCCNRGY